MLISFIYAVFLPLQLGMVWLISGLIVYLSGIIFTIVAVSNFATSPKDRVITNGLYRISRNPMYVGVLLVLLGEVLCAESASLLIYTLGVFLLFNIFIRLYEEPTLKRTFGQQYEDYCKAVPRWVPRLRPQDITQAE